ncbi:SDR family NAD(P)-dependent oxidoreductase [Streptomyces sp. NPDC059402]|uniref:SDR family NAD(P)-dependent oxidoreductase n=1 Tax=Streptomyces sp. NPDC059402 TaxID=3346822 RepID=UPI0036D018A5
MRAERAQVPVAVVGLAAFTPGSRDVAGFWRNVLAGRDLMTDVPVERWSPADHYDPDPFAPDKTYVRRGAFLPDFEFDPLAYGIPPSDLAATDTAQLLAMMAAGDLLADCGLGQMTAQQRERVGVVLGTSGLAMGFEVSARLSRPVWRRELLASGLDPAAADEICDRISANFPAWTEATFPGLLGNVVSGRIANRYDLHGVNHVTDAACASSLAALSTGLGELALGSCDLVICGGVDVLNDITMYVCFSKTPALSPTEDCRPFAADADGTMLGEAVIMFALKRLADAERDGDRIYAVVRGLGAASDGRSKAIYAPLAAGQERALRRAYDVAGYGPRSVELVEAHGTGTKAGDAAEFAALREVFQAEGRPDRQWCALGSAKSQFGHTKSSAGAVGMLKAVLALHHRVLPPTIKVGRPNPELELTDSPFYLNTATRPWISGDGRPRRAGVSSFGFGGTNFHVTLEEYVPARGGRRAWHLPAAPCELVLFSAPSPGALAELIRRPRPDRPLAAIARECQAAFRTAHRARLAVVADDATDLAGRLDALAARVEAGVPFSAPRAHFATGDPAPGRVAFLFPGQGAQYVGMGAELAVHHRAAREAWDAVAAVLPVHREVFPPPVFGEEDRAALEASLTATEVAQPALAAHSLALLAVLSELKLTPDCVAGHSFGELVALHAAGSFDAPTLVRLARRRGELMRDAATTAGGMLAVHAPPERIEELTEQVDGVWVAHHNTPRQVVLAGTDEALTAVEARCAATGVVIRRLNAAAAFHSPLVADATEPFTRFLADLTVHRPARTVYAGADAAPYGREPAAVRRGIAAQLAAPARFGDMVEAMYEDGVRTFVEVGPGTTLTGLTGEVLGDREHAAISLDRRGSHGLAAFHDGLGRAAVRGVAMDLSALWEGHKPVPEPDREEKPRMTVLINGGNHRDDHRGGRATPPASEPVASPDGAPGRPGPVVPPAEVSEATPPVPVPVPGTARPAPSPMPAAHVSVQPVAWSAPVSSAGPSAEPVPDPAEPAGPGPQAPLIPGQVASGGPGSIRPGTPAPVAAPSVRSTGSAQPAPPTEWLRLLAEAQRQSAEAHATYQRVTAENHQLYLRTAHASMEALLGAAGARPPALGADDPQPWPVAEVAVGAVGAQVVPAGQSVDAPMPSGTVPGSGESLRSGSGGDRDEVTAAVPVPSPRATVVPSPVEAPAPGPVLLEPQPDALRPDGLPLDGLPLDAESIGALLLEVVAERTGYPADIINLDMELEADLGVDSIKKVEVLSRVRQRVGELPAADLSELASLRTLREISVKVAQLAGQIDAAGDQASAGPSPVPPQTPGTSAPGSPGHVDSEPTAGPEATDAPAAEAPTATSRPEPLRLAVRALPLAPVGLALAGLRDRELLVLDDSTPVGPLLVEELAAHGVPARLVTALPAEARSVILLDKGDDAPAAFATVRGLSDRLSSDGGLLVTVQDTGGDFGLSGNGGRPAHGGLDALARTAAREWPLATVKAIDCARTGRSDQEVAAAIAAELTAGGPSITVGLPADGSRTVPLACPAVPGPVEPRADADSVIVVTGGARGVTAAAVRELAAAHRPRLVLLGRTALVDEPEGLAGATDEAGLIRLLATGPRQVPPAELAAEARRVLAVREVRQTLRALEDAGSPTRYLSVDTRDEAALRDALAEVRRDWGPITGVVHGAGVIADRLIGAKTDEQFARVYSTKVDGLRALLAATADDPLSLLVAFTSVSGVFGSPGQADYAMANTAVDHLLSAYAAARPDCLTRSVAWGPWDGGMVTRTIAERFRAAGVELIEPAAGARAFVAELADPGGPTRVLRAAGDLAPDVLAGQATVAELTLARPQYALLDDHRIDGAPVVPAAVLVHWFTGLARSWRPDTGPLVLHDLRVPRRIELREPGERLVLRGRTSTDGSERRGGLALELGTVGAKYAGAVVADGPPPNPHPWRTPEGLEEVPEPYDGPELFHGPVFQVLEQVRLGADGGVAALRPRDAEPWRAVPWTVDVAALDGALQLAVGWTARAGVGAALPVSIRECRIHRAGADWEAARVVVSARRTDGMSAECDAAVLSEDGTVLAELLGVELIRRPDPTEG